MTLVVVVSYGVMRALLQLLGFGWRHLGFLYTALTSYLNPCRGGGGVLLILVRYLLLQPDMQVLRLRTWCKTFTMFTIRMFRKLFVILLPYMFIYSQYKASNGK